MISRVHLTESPISHPFDYSNKRVVISGAFSGVGAAAADKIKGPIDVLFNNAGIAATHPVEDVMAVDWLGLRQLSELLLPKIREELYGWCREHPQLVGDGYAFSKECVLEGMRPGLHVDMGFNAFMTTGQIDFSGLA